MLPIRLYLTYSGFKLSAIVFDLGVQWLTAFFCSVESALATDINCDKFFPLRLTGSTMREITRILPIQSGRMGLSALQIFQLCIFRVFAFGEKSHIKTLTLSQTASSPDLNSLAALITTWGGASNIALPVYGQFQVAKVRVPTMLTLLWGFSQTLNNDYIAHTATGNPLTFASVYQSLANKKIPFLPAGGLVTWVLAADFVEYGVCLAPAEDDLAGHIMPSSKSSKGSPSGPTAGLKYAADTSGEKMPEDAVALAKVLRKITAVFNSPPNQMPTVRKMVRQCEEIQGRKINVVDFEHALCKIARQLSKAKGKKQKE